VDYVWIKVKKRFGYWADHKKGETFQMPIRHVQEIVEKGYIDICVNNRGDNLPYDEPEEGLVTPAVVEAEAPKEED
jgi:hypothetical protein